LLEQSMIVLDWVGPLCLCPTEVLRVPEGIPGVYLLQAFAPGFGGYPVFYAGRSDDLRRRLCEHLDDARAKPSVRAVRHAAAGYFSAAPVLQRAFLPRIEAGLIRALRPPCNDQIPTAAPLLVNLPPLKACVP
jgi:hypothetical protein